MERRERPPLPRVREWSDWRAVTIRAVPCMRSDDRDDEGLTTGPHSDGTCANAP